MKMVNFKNLVIFISLFIIINLFFISSIFAREVNIIAINYKYDFIVIDRGSSHGIIEKNVYYIIKSALQIGKVQIRKAKSNVSACDIIDLVEGAELNLGERISLVSKPKIGLEEAKYRLKDIPLSEREKDAKSIHLRERDKEIESKMVEDKQFIALKTKAQEIAKEVAEEKKKLLVSFNFKDADIKNVLRIISKQKKLNIIVSEDISGKITVNFKDVSVYKALDAILKSIGYTYIKEDGIIKVFPMPEGEVYTQHYVYRPKYAQVGNLEAIITNMLTEKGKVLLDEVLNRMMIIDYPSNLERIKNLLHELDEIPKQVTIEAKIVDVILRDETSLGINWSILSGGDSSDDDDDDSSTKRMDVHFTDQEGLSIFKFGTIGTTELEATISAYCTSDHMNILSEPSITTLNNKPAKIEVVGTIAYRVWEEEEEDGDTETTTRSFEWEEKQTGITLEVTPHIVGEDIIRLEVSPSTEELQEWLEDPDTGYAKGYPVITTRKINTEVIISEGYTLVIGGLIKKSQTEDRTGVPVLSDIPILGNLFRKKGITTEDTELMIFITPHIVEPGAKKK